MNARSFERLNMLLWGAVPYLPLFFPLPHSLGSLNFCLLVDGCSSPLKLPRLGCALMEPQALGVQAQRLWEARERFGCGGLLDQFFK